MTLYYNKITHHLLNKVENIFLRNILFIFIFRRCTKKLTGLFYIHVYEMMRALENKDVMFGNLILLILKTGSGCFPIDAISRSFSA